MTVCNEVEGGGDDGRIIAFGGVATTVGESSEFRLTGVLGRGVIVPFVEPLREERLTVFKNLLATQPVPPESVRVLGGSGGALVAVGVGVVGDCEMIIEWCSFCSAWIASGDI